MNTETTTIIILPGIQYTPKGALNVDKMEISAYVNNTQVTLYTLGKGPTKSVVLKETSDLSNCYAPSESPYTESDNLYSNTISDTIRRVKSGYFHRQDTPDQSYIGVFMPTDPKLVLNHTYFLQTAAHHDGLCYITILQDNVDIVFKIKLYSKVIWNDSKESDNYVLFDDFTISYNPVISGFANTSTQTAEPIQLYYDPTQEEDVSIPVKLRDNIIVLDKLDGSYKICKWRSDIEGYKPSDISCNPEEFKVYTYPLIMLDRSAYYKNTLVMDFGHNYVNIPTRGLMQYTDGIINAPGSYTITPIFTKKDLGTLLENTPGEKFDVFLKKIEKQKEYFGALKHPQLGIKAWEFHGHGIYNTNLFDEGNFELDSENDYIPLQFYCNLPELLEHTYDPLGLDSGEYPPRIKEVKNPGSVKTGPTQRGAIYRNNDQEVDLHSPKDGSGIVEQLKLYNKLHLNLMRASLCLQDDPKDILWKDRWGKHTTYYTWFTNPLDFSYLCNDKPYITIHNFGQPPKMLKKVNEDTQELKLKDLVVTPPKDFIAPGLSSKVSLHGNYFYEWKWDCGDYLQEWATYIFPNYCLSVVLDDSKLKFNNKSDYKVVPYITFRSESAYLGLYDEALVVSNINNEKNLFGSYATKEIPTGSYKQTVLDVQKNLINFTVNIEQAGLYVFKYNGFSSISTYQIDVKVNDLRKIIDLDYKHSYIIMFLPEGEYTFEIKISNTITFTGIGLYQVDTLTSGDTLYNIKLKDELQKKNYSKLAIIEDTEPLYDYVVLPAAYVYGEMDKIFYNKKYNSVYTPSDAYLNILGVYDADDNNKFRTITPKITILGGLAGTFEFNSDIDIKILQQ